MLIDLLKDYSDSANAPCDSDVTENRPLTLADLNSAMQKLQDDVRNTITTEINSILSTRIEPIEKDLKTLKQELNDLKNNRTTSMTLQLAENDDLRRNIDQMNHKIQNLPQVSNEKSQNHPSTPNELLLLGIKETKNPSRQNRLEDMEKEVINCMNILNETNEQCIIDFTELASLMKG